ncbi:MAG TPA: hypothetical protein VNH64_03090, partial [Parvularculaceae bacterium]|nr:hypothetical protein [Parvularculaceae bacterium]
MGGGYLNQDQTGLNPGFSMAVRASYPSGDNSWTVTFEKDSVGRNYQPLQAMALAYCMGGPSYPLNIVNVEANNGGNGDVDQSVIATCPSGSVVTGGGFRIDGTAYLPTDVTHNADVLASQPTLNGAGVADGWRVTTRAFRPDLVRRFHAYALCAQSGLEPLPAPKEIHDYTGGPSALDEHEASIQCPENGISTAGG